MPTRQVRSPGAGEAEVVKRHIGSLARIGWLPAFRSTRLSRGVRSVGPHYAAGEGDEVQHRVTSLENATDRPGSEL